MANNKFQFKRSSVSGVVPTTGDLSAGELGINLVDKKLFTANSTAVFELGSNLTSVYVGNTTSALTVNSTLVTIPTSIALSANGSNGTSGQVLTSNGVGVYWSTVSGGGGGVTSVATGNGLIGGTITTTGTISILANNGTTANTSGLFVASGTGIVVNTGGVHVNSSYIATLDANNSSFLGGTAAASYQLNSTLAANVATLAANSATYANSSSTNTFTVGTASYFVANGNVGIGNSSPAHKLRVEGTSSLAGALEANGTVGTAGQVLTSNSAGIYWSTVSGGGGSVNTDAQYVWTNTHTFQANLTIAATSELIIANGASIEANGTFGTSGQVLTSNSTGVYWSTVSGGGVAGANTQVQFNDSGTANATAGFTFDKVSNTLTATLISDTVGKIRDIPVITQSSAYQLAANDTGQCISTTTGGIVVNGAVLATGFTATIFNNAAANATITTGAGVTMYLAGSGSTGNRTLLQRGLATVICVAANTFAITGSGLF